MKTNYQKGQSVVELVFSVILLILFLTGAVIALVTAVAARGESLARKKAARLAEIVMEDLTGVKLNDQTTFWNLTPVPPQTMAGYPDFTYSVGYSLVAGTEYPSCSVVKQNCVDALVTVKWKRKNDNILELKKFFGKGF